jgi:alpha-D-xyloside xylohydrolase
MTVHRVASRVTTFDPATEFPGTEYDRDPVLPFETSFVAPRTLRLRLSTRDLPAAMMHGEPSLNLAGTVPSTEPN